MAAAETASADRAPVVVELFTSEGCSSCPPADRLLAEIEKQMGTNVIVLSEHVDYWDYIGWRDPFATGELTARQRRYSQNLPGDSGVYTPQMVIDGRTAFVGSDGKRAQARSGRRPRIRRRRSPSKNEANSSRSRHRFTHECQRSRGDHRSEPRNRCPRRQNSGRKLRHTGVVRALTNLGKADRGKTFAASFAEA